MKILSNIQSIFQQHILHADGNLDEYIVSTEKVCASDRIAIYTNAYRLRLIESLETDYPALYALLGEEDFYEMASLYIDFYPSTYRSLRWFGQDVANFLKNTKPYSKKPALSEMADFEWCFTKSFDAADKKIMSKNKIEKVSQDAWGKIHFIFSPSVQRFNFSWNVVSLWKAISAKEKLPALKKLSQPTPWMMWRNKGDIQFRSLNIDEAWAIDALIKGETFGFVCEGLCEWNDKAKVVARAATLLKEWITVEIIVDL